VLKYRIATTAFLTSILLSCPPTAKIEFFNNTAHTIVVAFVDTTKSIAPNGSREFRIHGSGGMFEIYFHDGVRSYALPLCDVPRGEFRNFWGGLYRVQLEDDRRLFILRRGQHSPRPVSELEQPLGFPLEPEHTGTPPNKVSERLPSS